MVAVGVLLKSNQSVDTATFNRSASVDDVLHCVTYLMFDRVSSLILNERLYLKDSGVSELFH